MSTKLPPVVIGIAGGTGSGKTTVAPGRRSGLKIHPHPITPAEAILAFAEPALRELFDVKIFVDTPPDIRFIRRLQRDISERGRTLDSGIRQDETTVRPLHLEFVEP